MQLDSTGRARRTMVAVAALALVAAACGAGSVPSQPRTQASPTTTDLVSAADAFGVIHDAGSGSSGARRSTTTAVVAPSTTSRVTAGAPVHSASVVAAPAPPPPPPPGPVQVTPVSTTAPAQTPQPGGTLTVLMPTEAHGFDPTKGLGSASGGDMQRMFAVYDALVLTDPVSGGVAPELAESVTSTDGRTWTMKLRQNVKFSDGTPFDSTAVKFNWDRDADPANGPLAAAFKNMTYQAVDGATVQITLTTSNNQFPRVLARSLSYIAAPGAVQAAGPGQAYNNVKPVGAGPFVVQSWTRDSQMVLVRNPAYWNAPRPYLDSIVFKVVTDESQRAAIMRAGGADAELTASAPTARDLAASFALVNPPLISTVGFGMNESRPPFNDRNVRRAMVLAVDRDQYNKVFQDNVYPTPSSAFPPNYPYSDQNIVFPQPNQAQAQQLIDGYFAANGKDVTFTYTYITGTAVADNAAKALQSQVNQLDHVHMDIKGDTLDQYLADLTAGNFDANTLSYVGVDPDPSFVNDVATGNPWKYSNPSADQAIADSRSAGDPDVRNQALKNLQQIVIDDAMFFPLARVGSFWLAKGTDHDLATFEDGGLLSDRVWLKTK